MCGTIKDLEESTSFTHISRRVSSSAKIWRNLGAIYQKNIEDADGTRVHIFAATRLGGNSIRVSDGKSDIKTIDQIRRNNVSR